VAPTPGRRSGGEPASTTETVLQRAERRGSGAAKEGAGRGSDPNSHGASRLIQAGGADAAQTASLLSRASRWQEETSTSTITLPSFGPGESDPAQPRTFGSSKARRGLGVSVFGTRGRRAFSRYGQLRETTTHLHHHGRWLAVMQYADSASAARPYTEKLIDPEPLRVSLPEAQPFPPGRCLCSRSLRTLSNIRVIEPVLSP